MNLGVNSNYDYGVFSNSEHKISQIIELSKKSSVENLVYNVSKDLFQNISDKSASSSTSLAHSEDQISFDEGIIGLKQELHADLESIISESSSTEDIKKLASLKQNLENMQKVLAQDQVKRIFGGEEINIEFGEALQKLQNKINMLVRLQFFNETATKAKSNIDRLVKRAHGTLDRTTLNEVKNNLENIREELRTRQREGLPENLFTSLNESVDLGINEVILAEKAIHLEELVKKGRSMQGYAGEVMSYDEYMTLKEICHRSGVSGLEISRAEKALLERINLNAVYGMMDGFKAKLKSICERHPEILTAIPEITSAVRGGYATPEQVQIVVECKKLLMDLVTDEGSIINVRSFKNKEGYEGLAEIEELAFLQGLEIDEQISLHILSEHLSNQPEGGAKPLRIAVEGAGPNGLYAALNLFMAGANVHVVNDRGERYVRNQILDIDPKWIVQLNFILGTKFDELFRGDYPLAQLDPDHGSGSINTLNLEDMLKARIVEIGSYAEHATGHSSYLNLHYETPMLAVNPPAGEKTDFSVKLGSPQRPSPDTLRMRQAAIDGISVRLLSEKYAHLDPDSILEGGITVLEKAVEEAVQLYEQEQHETTVREKIPELDIDALVCLGGTNDSIRDEYLCPAIPYTTPKNYGIALLLKRPDQKALTFLGPDDSFAPANREKIEPHLLRHQIDARIAGADFLPPDFRERHKELTSQILESIENHPMGMRIFENSSTFYCGAETPVPLASFIRELNTLAANADRETADKINTFKRQIEKEWFLAISNMFGVQDDQMEFDPAPINTGTFDVIQKGVDLAAKEMKVGDSSLIITALGDSRASPHFFSGSGMSSGRLGIERAASLLRDYNRRTISREAFVESLNSDLETVKQKVLQKGSPYVRPLTEEQMNIEKRKRMYGMMNTHFKRTQSLELSELGYKIDREIGEANRGFNLSYLDSNKQPKGIAVEVTPEGELRTSAGTYLVFNDLLMALQH